MQLDRLAIRARMRNPWESTDLGILLARRHWFAMFLAWLLPAAAAFTCTLVFIPESPGWGLLIAWWLKPAFDRLPLFIASRALFSEPVTARHALGQVLSLNRLDWLPWLAWRRLSPTRSFDLPVTLLERLTGARRGKRIRVLHRKYAGTATWLTLVAVHLEMILFLAAIAVLYLLVPQQLQLDWTGIIDGHELAAQWVGNGLYLLAMAAIAPFYVSAGFCLYIGRRIELEGWDIEIQFRKLRERWQSAEQRQPRARSVSAALLALCLATGATMYPEPSQAESIESREEAAERIEEVLQQRDFHQVEEVSGWRLKDRETQHEQLPGWLVEFIFWLADLLRMEEEEKEYSWGPLVATLMEVMLWLALAILSIHLLWRHRHRLQFSFRKQPPKPAADTPEVLFGLDVSRENLPDDICGVVMEQWQKGNARAALGLLYRATLSHLINRYGLAFGDQYTEHECATVVEQTVGRGEAGSPLVEFMWQLTNDWQLLAYAHRLPDEQRVQQHCLRWREIFDNEV
ncbi:hypothetical protein [Microbulbifer sp. JSM ZJ756]|uniref:hypothetical protein n=1 Tax=Microbulbifer sp. JSM ZJ756 TaxID=3376191 RepID=UPI00379100B9